MYYRQARDIKAKSATKVQMRKPLPIPQDRKDTPPRSSQHRPHERKSFVKGERNTSAFPEFTDIVNADPSSISWSSIINKEENTEKKALVIIRGIAYSPSYIHFSGNRVVVDFRLAVDSVRKNVIEDMTQNLGYGKVDVDLVTYDRLPEDVNNDLEKMYSPRKMHLIDKDPQQSSQREIFHTALTEVSDVAENQEYDIVVIIRFDTVIKRPLSSLRIRPDRVNFLWQEVPAKQQQSASGPTGSSSSSSGAISNPNQNLEKIRVTSDVIHVFPPKFTPAMKEAVEASKNAGHLHGLYPELLRAFERRRRASSMMHAPNDDEKHDLYPIFFVYEQGHESNTDAIPNPVYHILRHNRSAMLAKHTSTFWKNMLGKKWGSVVK